jgi:hypothetical protein
MGTPFAVKSRTTRGFRALLRALPLHVQHQADQAYRLFSDNPSHPRLRFRPVRDDRPLYSVRVGSHYRALGYRRDDGMLWIWIGSHAEYDHLIDRL